MPLDRRDVEASLKEKGFICHEDEELGKRHGKRKSDHRLYYFYYQGKRTTIRTKISRGSSFKEYNDKVLGLMSRALHFDSLSQLKQFVECPLTHEKYIEILQYKGIIQ